MCADRAATILARFNSAHNDLVWKLRDCAFDSGAQLSRGEGWSAAQIGTHVAMTNEFVAAVLTGQTPMAQPAPEGFQESFSPDALPAKAQAPAVLQPPAVVGLDAAIERLRASAQSVSKAIAALTPDRGAHYCVSMPFGTLSLFELADFTAAHVSRHAAQVQRSIARV